MGSRGPGPEGKPRKPTASPREPRAHSPEEPRPCAKLTSFRCLYLIPWPPWCLSGEEPACKAGDAVRPLGQKEPLEKGMAAQVVAWEIPCTEEPGGPDSVGSQSQNLVTSRGHARPQHPRVRGQPLPLPTAPSRGPDSLLPLVPAPAPLDLPVCGPGAPPWPHSEVTWGV